MKLLLSLCLFALTLAEPVCQLSGLRIDCGYAGITAEQCHQQGCCWDTVSPNPENKPWCFHSNPAVSGYRVLDSQNTEFGLIANLQLVQSLPEAVLGRDVEKLRLEVRMETDERLHVKISDPSVDRWQIPEDLLPRPKSQGKASNPLYSFSMTHEPFGFAVTRVSDGSVLFNSTPSVGRENDALSGLQFKEQFIEISTQLPSVLSETSLYGLGDSHKSAGFRLVPKTYTHWAIDIPCLISDANLYGSHPFYLEVRPNGKSHGVFLLNNHGMDTVLEERSLSYRIVGGVLDFYFFLGPSPDDVIREYTDVIGKPHMIPYWSLGFHQCKYGYESVYEVNDVVEKYAAAKIPLDTMWTDIEYMDGYRDFTFDKKNYPVPKMQELVNKLHKNGQKYVLIVDPAIKIDPGYQAYDRGLEMDIFIKGSDGKPAVGEVWPGSTHFPDFTHPNVSDYWTKELKDWMSMVPVDGLWIDMNEPSSFFDGRDEVQSVEFKHHGAGFDPVNPPYDIRNAGSGKGLNHKTLSMATQHHNGVLHYDLHNLYGFTESIVTRKSLLSLRPGRPFVLSRSTFPGSGVHAGHWTGDNAATWNDLKWSISAMLEFQMYGIPYVGADICGFQGDTTEELCARWIQLGSFYPFSRDHSAIGTKPQELYLWESVAENARNSLKLRYALLPYWYTLFYHSHISGTPVVKPLVFEFGDDVATHKIDKQFLLGSSILVSPVLEQGSVEVDAYFPRGVWYNILDHESVQGPANVRLEAPLNVIPVHIRGGSVIPTQEPGMTTVESRKLLFGLLVALDEEGSASGVLYLDDGDSLDVLKSGAYSLVSFSVSGGQLVSSVSHSGYVAENSLDEVLVFGVKTSPSVVSLNGVALKSDQISYDDSVGSLLLRGLKQELHKGFVLEWN